MKPIGRSLVATGVVLGLSVSQIWAADDAGLYGPGVPQDATFVRIVDYHGGTGVGTTFDSVPVPTGPNGVTPYQILQPGSHQLTLGAESVDLLTEAHRAYTVAMDASGKQPGIVITDTVADDPAKTSVALYNFTSISVSLRALAKEVAVFDSVLPGTGQERQINPVKVDLKVRAGEKLIGEFPGTTLEPHSMVAFFAFDVSGAVVVKSEVTRGEQ